MLRARCLLVLTLGLPPLALAGCQAVAAVVAKTAPPQLVPAAFKLGDAPTAVSVRADERRVGGVAAACDTDPVVAVLRRELRERADADIVLSSANASRLVVVDLIGDEAEGVIGGPYAPGRATGRVRVLDAEGTELWPADGSNGRAVAAGVPPATAGSAEDVRRAALRLLGAEVAKLFYAHEPALE